MMDSQIRLFTVVKYDSLKLFPHVPISAVKHIVFSFSFFSRLADLTALSNLYLASLKAIASPERKAVSRSHSARWSEELMKHGLSLRNIVTSFLGMHKSWQKPPKQSKTTSAGRSNPSSMKTSQSAQAKHHCKR